MKICETEVIILDLIMQNRDITYARFAVKLCIAEKDESKNIEMLKKKLIRKNQSSKRKALGS